MSKLLNILMAGAFALTLGACANPWWDRGDDSQPTATESQDTGTGTTAQDSQSPSDEQVGQQPSAEHNEAFAQAIEQCQSMQGTAYQDCVDKARRDHGQM